MRHWLISVYCVLLYAVNRVVGENCPPITNITLRTELPFARLSGEVNAENYPFDIYSFTINCEVVDTVKGTFQHLSLTVSYRNTFINMDEVARVTLNCDGGVWRADNLDTISDSTRQEELLNSDITFTNCSGCKGGGQDGPFECEACSSACNVGFEYCTGTAASDCCNYYDDNVCVASCDGNQFVNSSFDCACDPFYQEPQCTVCTIQQSDCQNGGTPNTDTCECDCSGTGYSGLVCSEDIDECTTSNPCTLANTDSCVNTNGSYECVCLTGFDGMNCQNNIDDCMHTLCLNGATCNDGIASYTCSCVPGYTADDCSIDIDECESDPCQNGGTCRDLVNGYSCDCVDQYKGTECHEDVNECDADQSPCLNQGSCRNIVGGYECSCVGRWTNPTCDECVIDNCVRTNCSGPRFECLECVDRYTPIHSNKSDCVLCTIGNCTSCSSNQNCVECAFNLVANGTHCNPRDDGRRFGSVELGAILGVIIGLAVIVAVVVVTIIIVFTVSLKIRAAKPVQYGAKNPIEIKDPIVLQKTSAI